ncbi:hypothetical protein F5Y09DRAFT_225959 [Xylaria sp. FL1042]|nr:hypothetical protein F5Y09DRAFT_225959 [Xylaria sp. FL1042]
MTKILRPHPLRHCAVVSLYLRCQCYQLLSFCSARCAVCIVRDGTLNPTPCILHRGSNDRLASHLFPLHAFFFYQEVSFTHRTLNNPSEQNRKHSGTCEHASACNCTGTDTYAAAGARASVTTGGSSSSSSSARASTRTPSRTPSTSTSTRTSTRTTDHRHGHNTYTCLTANTDADALYHLYTDRDSYPDRGSKLNHACNRTLRTTPNAAGAHADADGSTHASYYEQPYCFVAGGTCSNTIWESGTYRKLTNFLHLLPCYLVYTCSSPRLIRTLAHSIATLLQLYCTISLSHH